MRPTFDGQQRTIETFLLTPFDGGHPEPHSRSSSLRRVRDERKFESPEALKAQILRDVERANDVLPPARRGSCDKLQRVIKLRLRLNPNLPTQGGNQICQWFRCVSFSMKLRKAATASALSTSTTWSRSRRSWKLPVRPSRPSSCRPAAALASYSNDRFLNHLMLAATELYPEIPIALHQDHGNSPATCKSAIEMGFTSVMMDGSLMADGKTPADFEYNVRVTREVVEMAHATRRHRRRRARLPRRHRRRTRRRCRCVWRT